MHMRESITARRVKCTCGRLMSAASLVCVSIGVLIGLQVKQPQIVLEQVSAPNHIVGEADIQSAFAIGVCAGAVVVLLGFFFVRVYSRVSRCVAALEAGLLPRRPAALPKAA
jgi:hypothetical protein